MKRTGKLLTLSSAAGEAIGAGQSLADVGDVEALELELGLLRDSRVLKKHARDFASVEREMFAPA